ncbi:MAG: hypothetical protein DRH26_01760 [Deltaproteobacteria bacterium]|nr:MAG: hypothetical protein DRH26_01760 [Deltaproteobacteria bacterium]
MTSAIPGFDGQIYISTDGGSNYSKIAEIRDMTLTVENEIIDATSHDSGGWREYIAGLKNWKLSGGNLYIAADAGQVKAFTALTGDTKVRVQFNPKDTTGLDQYWGDAYVNSQELNAPNDDAADMSYEITGTGAITKGTIS